MRGNDLAVATLVALAVITILVVWRFRLCGKDLDGYWATLDGDTFHLRVFDGGIITVAGPGFVWQGKIRPLRSIQVSDPAGRVRRGSVDLAGRWLTWDDGASWIRQGPIGA